MEHKVKRLRTAKEARDGMDPFQANQNAVKDFYVLIKGGMQAVAAGHDMKLDRNAAIVTNLIFASIHGFRIPPGQKYSLMKHYPAQGEGAAKVDAYYSKVDWTPNQQVLDAWVQANFSTNQAKAKIFPFITIMSIAIKTEEAILWQDNTVTRELGLGTWADVFARGKNIRNKYKNSRRLAIGPVAHLFNAWGTQNRFASQTRNNEKMKRPAFENIMNQYHTVLFTQLVSPGQREILRQIFFDREWINLRLLVASMTVIKPHLEHYFVLTPDLIAALTEEELNGANMNDEWVFKAVKAGITRLKIFENAEWTNMITSIKLHAVFGTCYEDLRIVERMWTTAIPARNELGRYSAPTGPKYNSSEVPAIDYNFWCKPQKGAPINIGVQRMPQINTVPSLRGKRPAEHHNLSLADLEKTTATGTFNSLKEQLSAEFEMYRKVETECTGEFYSPGTTNPYTLTLTGTPKYMFGNPPRVARNEGAAMEV